MQNQEFNSNIDQEFASNIANGLKELELTTSIQKRIKLVGFIFDKLCSLEGKRFMQSFIRFENTVRKKLEDLYNNPDFSTQAKKYYFCLFEEDITKAINVLNDS